MKERRKMSAKALKLVNRTRFSFLRERASEGFWEAALRRSRVGQDFEFYVLPGDRIGNTTISNGLFERHEIQALEHLLELRRSKDGHGKPGVFLDVGANIGAYSVALSSKFAEVIAFEPNPIVANILRANLAQNRRSNVRVVEKALGAEATKASLFSIERWNVGMASLTPSRDAEEIAKVDVVKGDDFLGGIIQQDTQIELLKIDVEGHEPYALKGLLNTLKTHQPLIAFEVRGAKAAEEITGVLTSAGYKHFYWIERPKWHAIMGRLGRVLELIWLGADIRLTPIQTFSDTFYSMVVGTPTPIES
jgi:FkbM family methyltransferase